MKGPYERLKYDLRRVWECPVCHHRERSPGDVTAIVCRCQEKQPRPVFMKLTEDGVRRNVPPLEQVHHSDANPDFPVAVSVESGSLIDNVVNLGSTADTSSQDAGVQNGETPPDDELQGK